MPATDVVLCRTSYESLLNSSPLLQTKTGETGTRRWATGFPSWSSFPPPIFDKSPPPFIISRATSKVSSSWKAHQTTAMIQSSLRTPRLKWNIKNLLRKSLTKVTRRSYISKTKPGWASSYLTFRPYLSNLDYSATSAEPTKNAPEGRTRRSKVGVALAVTKLIIKFRQLPGKPLCIMPRGLMRHLILLPGYFIMIFHCDFHNLAWDISLQFS